MRICFCPRVRTRTPFAKHSWHTGCADWNFDETFSATGRGLALPHLKQTSGKPRLLTMLLLACTIMFGSDRTSLLNSSGRFFFLSSCRKLSALVTRNREIKNSGLKAEKRKFAFSWEMKSVSGHLNLSFQRFHRNVIFKVDFYGFLTLHDFVK